MLSGVEFRLSSALRWNTTWPGRLLLTLQRTLRTPIQAVGLDDRTTRFLIGQTDRGFDFSPTALLFWPLDWKWLPSSQLAHVTPVLQLLIRGLAGQTSRPIWQSFDRLEAVWAVHPDPPHRAAQIDFALRPLIPRVSGWTITSQVQIAKADTDLTFAALPGERHWLISAVREQLDADWLVWLDAVWEYLGKLAWWSQA